VTHTVNAPLGIAGSMAAPAVYAMSAGELTALYVTVGGAGGGTAAGRMNVSGGTATVSVTLTIGSGDGVMNLSGGTLTAPTTRNEGVVNGTGGAFAGSLVNTGTVRVGGGAKCAISGGLTGPAGGAGVGQGVRWAGGRG